MTGFAPASRIARRLGNEGRPRVRLAECMLIGALVAAPAGAPAGALAAESAAPASRAAPMAPEHPVPPAASLLRATLLVADLERSRAFYERLGFVVEGELGGARDPGASKFPLNAPATRSRLLILASPAGGGRLGLLEFAAPAPAAVRPARERIGVGDLVLVLDVADATAVYAHLTAAGYATVEEPQVYRSRRTDGQGRPLEGRVFHVFDPDGNLVELLEPPTPADAPR